MCGFRIKYTTTQNLFCMETDSLPNSVMTTEYSYGKATQSTHPTPVLSSGFQAYIHSSFHS